MRVSIKDVAEAVLLRLNENPVLPESLVDYAEPWMDLRNTIGALLPGVAERVILEADVEEIAEFLPLTGSVIRRSAGTVTYTLLPLPSDFLRLVYIRMSDWSEEVHGVIGSNSDALGYRRLRERRRGYGRALRPWQPAFSTGEGHWRYSGVSKGAGWLRAATCRGL